jgi:hypothetical protein
VWYGLKLKDGGGTDDLDRAEIQIPDHDGGHDASSHNAGASGDRCHATMRTIRKDFIHLWFRFFSRGRPPARRSLGGPIRSPTATLFTAGKVNGPARPLASP